MTETAPLPDISIMAYRQRSADANGRRHKTVGQTTASQRLRESERRAVAKSRSRLSRRHATFDVTSPNQQRQALSAIERAVVHVFGVAHGDIGQGTRGEQRVSLARQVAMYLAHVSCGLSLTEVGQLFGRDRTTVAHGCLKVEMRRDNTQFDHALDVLGWAIPALIQRPMGHPTLASQCVPPPIVR